MVYRKPWIAKYFESKNGKELTEEVNKFVLRVNGWAEYKLIQPTAQGDAPIHICRVFYEPKGKE